MTSVSGDWRPDEETLDRVQRALRDCRQGDVARPGLFVQVGDAGNPLTPETAALSADRVGAVVARTNVDAVVVVSQTCDVVRDIFDAATADLRPFVQVAPLVQLDGQSLAYARSGRSPRFAAVVAVSDDVFADLDRTTTIEKAVLAGLERERGCPDDASARAFSAAVARHRGRFAFPDDFELSLRRLKQRLIDKVGKASPEGRLVDSIDQIRARPDPDWEAEAASVELWFLVDSDSLPVVDPTDAVSPVVEAWCAAADRPIVEIATRLDGTPLDARGDRSVLWQALATAYARLAEPSGSIVSVTAAAESVDHFPISGLRWSDQLDLDHFSSED